MGDWEHAVKSYLRATGCDVTGHAEYAGSLTPVQVGGGIVRTPPHTLGHTLSCLLNSEFGSRWVGEPGITDLAVCAVCGRTSWCSTRTWDSRELTALLCSQDALNNANAYEGQPPISFKCASDAVAYYTSDANLVCYGGKAPGTGDPASVGHAALIAVAAAMAVHEQYLNGFWDQVCSSFLRGFFSASRRSTSFACACVAASNGACLRRPLSIPYL